MMKTKRIIIIIFVLSMIALIFSGCDGGGPVIPLIPDNGEISNYFQLDVPYIEQNSDNTCLPASAAMVLKYYEDPRDIVEIRDKLALPWQEDGTGGIMVSNHGDADKLFDYVKSLGFKTKKEWDGLTIEKIKNKLKEGFPIIVLQDFNLDEYKENDGHFSVIVGYREIGESDEENKLIINDPWWSNRGQYWEVTYSDFKIRNTNWWKEQHNLDSDLSHSYMIWKDMSGIYTITASAGPHGSISPSGNINVNQGSDKSFTITPDSGYSIDDVLVDGSSVGTVSSYTFTNVTEDHTISASFISVAPGLVHNLTKGTYYDTIQEALDDADNDNIIEVSDGTYDESITFPFIKKIILQSVNGASSTIIRGNDGLATITTDASREGTTLEGFTITHVSGNYGKGIYTNGNLTIKNCIISGNSGWLMWYMQEDGGGIYNYKGSITITGSTISGNTGDVGGIDNYSGNLTITGSTISGNSSYYNGGGICFGYWTSGTLPIGGSSDAEKNTICGNYKSGEVLSLDQQIRDYSGSLYETYKDTNYISVYCD